MTVKILIKYSKFDSKSLYNLCRYSRVQQHLAILFYLSVNTCTITKDIMIITKKKKKLLRKT